MEPQFYKGNRDAFMEKLEPGSLALFFSGSPVRKTADEDYGYFANRNFVYLTGMEQKDTVLMMEKDASGYRETLFILPPNLIEERWTGSRMKPEEIEAVSMISSFAYKETFEEELKKVLEEAIANKENGVILLTEKFGKEFPDIIDDVRLNHRLPLLVEIPDRHGTGRAPDFITSYVNEAIGLKL